MNILKMVQDVGKALANFTPEQRQAIDALASIDGAKLSIPTPGKESKLNGLTAADISSLARNMAPGHQPTLGDLTEALGGNRKSPRDIAKVKAILPSIPELEYAPGRRTTYTVRSLAGPKAD